MVSEVESINLQNVPVQYIDLSTMPTAQKIVLKKKLKTELAYVRTRIECFGGHSERLLINEHHCSVKGTEILEEACSGDREHSPMSRKRKLHTVRAQQKEAGNISYDEGFAIEKSEAVSSVTAAFKGHIHKRLDGQNVRGVMMDVTKIKQCCNILMTLMNHRNGWVFSQPVDPVKLNIPDYLSIIKKPMDLGTIKNKLKRKHYPSTHEFAADVRLTFSNAMSYNPPDNPIHKMADDLNRIFNARWGALEFKWSNECSVSLQQSVRKTTGKTSKQILQRVHSCNSSSLSSKLLTIADKLKLQNSLAKISRRNLPPKLLKFLQKASLLQQNEDKINVDIDSLDETTLWDLHQIVRSCEDAGSIKPAGQMKNSQCLMKECYKGGTRVTCSTGAYPVPSAFMDSNHPCISADRLSSHQIELTQVSISDVDSEGSSGRRNIASHSVASRLDGENFSVVQRNNAISDTVGRMVGDIDNAQPTSNPSSQPAASPVKEIDFLYEEQLSPARALRAAKLKSRFADTILKAQQNTLLNHSDEDDPARMHREREKLEKQRQHEKERIEAQVKAAEAAVRMKAAAELKMQRERADAELKMQRERADAELKMRREREREAARLAVQKMEKTVDIDENSRFFKDLENLGYSQPVHLDLENFVDAVEQQCALANPLAQLGLFIKEDDLDEDFDTWISSAGDDNIEEGEIGLS